MIVSSYSDRTDEELIDLTLDADRQAFGEIVERYHSMVARTVKGMLGDAVFAEDIGQDAFIRLYKSLSDFRGEAKLSTYLNRIAVNLTLNEIKRRKRSGGIVGFTDTGDHQPHDVADENDHDRRDVHEVVNKALQMLEPKFRKVVVMRLLEGYSTRETAEVLDLPQGTVLSRLSRAQEQLKVIISKMK
ncbi:MAG TPA: RNA polymerase sigma factor [Bacteroidales bacterium]|nr:RNA polymerase sigma factor [Bacteroidales bacterium]